MTLRPSARARLGVALAAVFAAVSANAADKSGIRPNVIDLPTGPGSISGLGEQFEPDLNTGSARYSVKLAVPPGTAGFAPSLALTYDSGQGDGLCGMGWTLDVGGIQRQTDHGLPQYGATDRYLYNGQEIVPLGNGVFRLKNEGAFVRFRQSPGGYWEADLRDGTLLRFGVSTAARVADSNLGTFKWALEQMADVNGNRILFTYTTDGGQLYLSRIDYNARPGAAQNAVIFEYEARSDALTDFRAGFGVTTAQRLKRVRMLASGQPVRRYELAYDASSTHSMLQSVTMYGTDDTSSLPPITFGYTGFDPSNQSVQTMANPPAWGLNDPNTELTDFDGDSLPDLVHTELNAHTVFYNQGGTWGPATPIPNSPSVQLATNGVQIADVNGDGIADLVAKLSSTEFIYFPNKGNGQWEAPVSFGNNPPFSFEDSTVRPIDIDGDGLTDVMQTTASNYYYWRNNGDGTWSAPLTGAPIPNQQILFSDAQVKLADMNGDRLVDLVYVTPGSLVYWPNMGYGRWGPMVTLAGAPDAGADQPRVQVNDLDGDGLADLWLASGTQLQVWLQKGDGTLAAPVTYTGMPDANPLTTVVRAADMNGSGTPDVVWNTPSSGTPWQYLDLSGGVRPRLLKAIDNGLGRAVAISYTNSGALYQAAASTGKAWSTRLPMAVQLVGDYSVSDGRGWSSSHAIDYGDGYYDGATRQFRGFARATVTDAGDSDDATAVTEHDFDVGIVDEALKGAPLAVEVRTDAGTVLLRDELVYQVHVYASGVDGRRVAGADRTRHDRIYVEGSSSPITTREEFTYDDYGDVLVHSMWGVVANGDPLAGNDECITTTTYASDPAKWLLGRPADVVVADAAGNRLAETHTYYDGTAFQGLPLGQLGDRGLLTREERWVEGNHFAQTQRIDRDAFGLATATLDALGTRREVDFDPDTHRFPIAERIVLGDHTLSMTAEYDPISGQLLRYHDVAGRVTSFAYDPFLKLISIARPGDSDALPSETYSYRYGAPLSEVVTKRRVFEGKTDTVESHAFYDGLGRRVGIVADAEDGKTLVEGIEVFGPRGDAVRSYEPFFASGYSLAAPPAATASTQRDFDALGRAAVTIAADGTRSETHFGPLSVESWDAEDLDAASPHHGTPRLQRSNALGVYEVDEDLGGRSIVTRFDRDALARVTRVQDAIGAVSTYAFDGLGRPVTIDHADAGKITATYDDAGNRLTREDARGARVVASYDPAGRPTAETTYDAAGKVEETVKYHYDDPSPRFPSDPYSAGALTWVEDESGELHYRRDERDRVTTQVRVVDGKDYALAQEFDDLDQPVRVTYPDGRVLDHHYNARGYLESVPGVVDLFRYDERGLPVRRELANGAVTTAAYDAMRRVKSLETDVRGATIQRLSFGYDNVGHVLAIDDAVHPSGPASDQRRFAYDDLYRLVSAQSPDKRWTYAFDDAGDLLNRSGVGDYTYGKAHQLSTIAGKSYRYDEAGELVERPGSKQTYDAKGRLASVTEDDGTALAFRYDYLDRRVVKEVNGPKGSHRAVYVDPLSEERDGKILDYVFVGDMRVARLGGDRPAAMAASLMGELPALLTLLAAGALLASLLFRPRRRPRSWIAVGSALAFLATGCGGCHKKPKNEPQTVYYHPDQIGSVEAMTDGSGAVVAENSYDPYGSPIAASSEPYSFTGKERDVETGLVDMGARAYDPAVGRFLGTDPVPVGDGSVGIGDPQTLNPYSYARNTPTRYVDPSGKWIVDAAFAAYDAYKLIKEPSWGNAGWLALDVVAAVVPLVPGSILIKGVAKGAEVLHDAAEVEKTVKDTAEVAKVVSEASHGAEEAEHAAHAAEAGHGAEAGHAGEGAGAAGDAAKAKPRKTAYRYASEGEKKEIERTGRVPNYDVAKRPKTVFMSPNEYKTTEEAEEALQIGSKNPHGPTAPPQYRVTADVSETSWNYAGSVEGGGGVEMTTRDSPPAINIEPLRHQ